MKGVISSTNNENKFCFHCSESKKSGNYLYCKFLKKNVGEFKKFSFASVGTFEQYKDEKGNPLCNGKGYVKRPRNDEEVNPDSQSTPVNQREADEHKSSQ